MSAQDQWDAVVDDLAATLKLAADLGISVLREELCETAFAACQVPYEIAESRVPDLVDSVLREAL